MKLIIILLFVLYTSIITPAADDLEIACDASELVKGSGIWVSKNTKFSEKNITIIGGPLYILGETRIGNGCTIYPFSVIKDCIIEDNVIVLPNCVLEESTFKAKSKIGPFTYVSEKSIIGEGAVIGTFVQVKRSDIGAGAKAQHITYLSDTIIGKKVNIGGGTITCNYDGVSKHKTFIGDNAFIGSNSTLVAPLTIGNGAYTAAGSTITEAVPGDGFAIARSKQTTKHGYASKLLAKFRAALKDQN